MAIPSWFDALPEVMGEAEYRELPEDVARSIEVVHGHVIKCESPAPQHNRIARRLASSLETARPVSGPCMSVETDIDVVLWRVPKFTFRRPDVVVYKCLDDPGQKPEASQTLAVVEVSSPGTVREDLTDKRVQYAASGIPLYLLIMLDEKYEIVEVKEFHLDAVSSDYRLHQVHRSELELELPIRATIPFLTLTAP
ncbi:Uma2 family endonuclease [Nonomuraea aurantiaca]|jgi:Uma2 family endonuclease|uniref:Uma2 family endonuclease n=1 Tax=Nonomuraea aurantiaca TaxID=2878562 RepID=UPI001CDA50D2|nr:Uma2 family endonuclease [Nonomuraea aurantiaca]MCA2225423.1 Uma2 family endonuclease [Nonomuraea aurantiaca]